MSSPRPSALKKGKQISTQTPKPRETESKSPIGLSVKSRSCQSDINKAERHSAPSASPSPSTSPCYTGQPIYIQMPTYNPPPQQIYPYYYPYYPPNYYQYPQTTEHLPHKHEASIQTKEVFTTAIQTLSLPTYSSEADDISSESISLQNESAKQKAWAHNFGSELSPAELLKKRKALYKKLIENEHPYHSIFHSPKNEESLLRIRKDYIKPKNQDHSNKRPITLRLEKLSMPKHS